MFLSPAALEHTVERALSRPADRTASDRPFQPSEEDGCTVRRPPLRFDDPGVLGAAAILAAACAWLAG